MAQFDLFWTDEGELLLDCQANLLARYNSRIVVPLLELHPGLPALSRLNPRFMIAGRERQMMTEFLSAVPLRSLKNPAGSLRNEEYRIKAALDMLVSGY